MKLPALPKLFQKKEKTAYFLALLLRDEKVDAVVIEQAEGIIRILNKHEVYFSTTLEAENDTQLVGVFDRAISQAESTLPEGVETTDTIFGIKDSWVAEKKITKQYLSKLKHICQQLALTPIGFIVLSEAIAHLIQTEEGSPLTALITEVGRHTVTISLFRAGKLIETHHARITASPMETVDATLKLFEHVEILPSRVILFHADLAENTKAHRDELAQKFIAHHWSKGLPFLHVPQISILPPGFDAKAVVAGAATQLGLTFEHIMEKKTEEIATYEKQHKIPQSQVEKGDIPPRQAEDAAQILSPEKKVYADNFGFILNQDIATLSSSPLPQSTPPPDPVRHEVKQFSTDNLQEPIHEDEMAEEEDETENGDESASQTTFVPSEQRERKPFGNKKLFFIPPLILLLLVGLFAYYMSALKATVTVFVSPRMVDETEKVILSPTSENDFSKNILAAQEIKVTLDGTKTVSATGEKEIGEKAKGTITIYNSEQSKKTIREGTKVTSANGLTYTVDKETSIASASGDIFSGLKSGTVQTTVTAEKIGSEYNLPSNTKFSIDGSNTLAAKNDSAFAGGSKKKVTVVAKEDIESLTKSLPESLEKQATEEINKKMTADSVLLPEFTNNAITEKEFNKKTGDEAKEVSITAQVTFTALTYQKQDITQFAQSLLKNKFSQNQTIPEEYITPSFGDVKTDNESITGMLEIKAGLLPKLDTRKIAADIAGKSVTDAQTVMKKLPQVKTVSVQTVPNLPFIPKMLPKNTDHITILIKANE